MISLNEAFKLKSNHRKIPRKRKYLLQLVLLKSLLQPCIVKKMVGTNLQGLRFGPCVVGCKYTNMSLCIPRHLLERKVQLHDSKAGQ
ncbi:uncharacterized protein DFL_004923 [Arthrobotrys flagrans]|uniref:Uncharacterized protein n=1 Tax=Arthrobotrys flagrans TaxID=97331 RepID=A0A437A6L3_ARTFL|nr:hypothetical protein DFL_004923 [Arthrobotrys flagrans]